MNSMTLRRPGIPVSIWTREGWMNDQEPLFTMMFYGLLMNDMESSYGEQLVHAALRRRGWDPIHHHMLIDDSRRLQLRRARVRSIMSVPS